MIQEQIISKIILNKDPSLVTLNGLTEKFFSDYKSEFKYILNHYKQYGSVPDDATFLNVFPDFELLNVEEPDSYLIDELYKDYQTRAMASSFNKVRDYLMSGDVDKALALYKKDYEEISAGVAIQSTDILKDTSRYEDYVDKTQDYGKYYIKTGFKELDDLIGGWDRQEELATIIARPNVGKCLAKGTKVLMEDGNFKKVEDIKVGDRVQSETKANTVLALHSGVSNGYKIIPSIGEPFIVSSNHILTLMHNKKCWDKDRKISTSNNTLSLVDITVEDYLSLSENKKRQYSLYTPSLDYSKKDLLIDPYILGLWLGDGTSCRVEITSVDTPIVEAWKSFALNYGLHCSEYKNQKGQTLMYDITTHQKGGKNPVKELFDSYNLLNNKHIPLDYMTSSREQRLELLAGILDTDGYLEKKNRTIFEFTVASKSLRDEVVRLARSLGFKASRQKERKVKDYTRYTTSISGDTYLIPTRLERKQAIKIERKHPFNPKLTHFKVEAVDRVEYYGFMADGDHRYIMENGFLTHNSWILIKIAEAAVKQGLRVGLYSGEMSEKKVGYRFDTLAGHISNGAMIHGNAGIQNEYKKYIDELPNKYQGCLKVLTPISLNGPAGVTALRAFIEKEKLDVLLIDQHSLLKDDSKGATPTEKAANISRDLKNLQRLKEIPIISVSQMNRTKNEGDSDAIDLAQIAQADRIGQDSTVVIGLSRDKKDSSLMRLHIVKSRDSGGVGQILSYITDLNKGLFIYVDEGEGTSTSETSSEEDLDDRYKVEENPF